MKFLFPDKKTPVLFQGITSENGLFQLQEAITYGTNIVAGVTQDLHHTELSGIPLYHSVKQALRHSKPRASVVFSTPAHALQDVSEAIKAKIPLIICTTEHVPMHDALQMIELAHKNSITLLGPSSNGIINVEQSLTGTLPKHLFTKGSVSIIGRSSSLVYEAVQQLANKKVGISKCITLGTDHLIGTTFTPIMQALLQDRFTQSILIIGQVHGQLEQELADFLIKSKLHKKVFIYIPGQSILKSEKRPLLDMSSVVFSDIIKEKYQKLQSSGVSLITTVDQIAKSMTFKRKGKR